MTTEVIYLSLFERSALKDVSDHYRRGPSPPTVPPLANVPTFNELLRRYANNSVPGHFYDAETKQWFGVRNPHLIAPGVTVEFHSNAPEGVGRYAIIVWIIDNIGDIRPETFDRRNTLSAANRYAAALHKVWTAAGGTIQ